LKLRTLRDEHILHHELTSPLSGVLHGVKMDALCGEHVNWAVFLSVA